MSSYTMELKTYIEKFSQYQENLSIKERIEIGRNKLFDFDYPLFDDNYRRIFETNFIRKFYMREIGFETEGAFKFHLETWLNINMPYYNKLFESELIKYDPLVNSSMDVTHNLKKDKEQNDLRDINQSSSSSGESEGKSTANTTGSVINDDFMRKLDSTNPDMRLQLTANDGEGVIEYANEIQENNANRKENTNSNSTGDTTNKGSSETTATQDEKLSSNINEIEDFIQHRQGKIGVQSYAKMIDEYRKSFIRIENMIHNELQYLFMLVY